MENYPGRKTEFFIVINNETLGPIRGLKGLFEYPVNMDTPVWYDGLDDWMPLALAPLTAPLFAEQAFRQMVMNDDLNEEPSEDEKKDESEDIPEIPNQVPDIPTGTPPPDLASEPHPYTIHVSTNAYQNAAKIAHEYRQKPKSFLGWAIAVTILFNFLAGIVAIVYSTKVNSKFMRGDIESSQRCSDTAQWWIAISITLGLIMIVANLFTGGLI